MSVTATKRLTATSIWSNGAQYSDGFQDAVRVRESIRDDITELSERDWDDVMDFLESTR